MPLYLPASLLKEINRKKVLSSFLSVV